jgi:hypothetical protein
VMFDPSLASGGHQPVHEEGCASPDSARRETGNIDMNSNPRHALDNESSPCTEVLTNTLLNMKRLRDESSLSEVPLTLTTARSPKRRLRSTARVRFQSLARVRVLDPVEDPDDGVRTIPRQDEHPSQEPATHVSYVDIEVETRLVDGPTILAQVTSRLLRSVSKMVLDTGSHDCLTPAACMWSIHTTLLRCGVTTVSTQTELQLLSRVISKLRDYSLEIQACGRVTVLPGPLQMGVSILTMLFRVAAVLRQAYLMILSRSSLSKAQKSGGSCISSSPGSEQNLEKEYVDLQGDTGLTDTPAPGIKPESLAVSFT